MIKNLLRKFFPKRKTSGLGLMAGIGTVWLYSSGNAIPLTPDLARKLAAELPNTAAAAERLELGESA